MAAATTARKTTSHPLPGTQWFKDQIGLQQWSCACFVHQATGNVWCHRNAPFLWRETHRYYPPALPCQTPGTGYL